MFKLDSPLMTFLNKVADILILSIVFMVACIPIFTGGAAFTAAYYMSFKMVKNEETYIVRGFFKAFKENFKQATIIWLFVLLLGGLIFADYYIILESGMDFPRWIRIATVTVSIIAAFGAVFVFPLQAYFSNTVKNTIKNAFLMALSHIPSAFLLVAIYAVPYAIVYFVNYLIPAVFLLGFGCIFYFKAFVLLKVFKHYEPEDETQELDDEAEAAKELEALERVYGDEEATDAETQ